MSHSNVRMTANCIKKCFREITGLIRLNTAGPRDPGCSWSSRHPQALPPAWVGAQETDTHNRLCTYCKVNFPLKFRNSVKWSCSFFSLKHLHPKTAVPCRCHHPCCWLGSTKPFQVNAKAVSQKIVHA